MTVSEPTPRATPDAGAQQGRMSGAEAQSAEERAVARARARQHEGESRNLVTGDRSTAPRTGDDRGAATAVVAPGTGAATVAHETERKRSSARPQRTRKARLRLARIDPWSAMKTSFLFAIAGGIMFWVATYLVWAAIGASGLFDYINTMVASIINAPGQQDAFQIQRYVSTNKVLGLAAVLAFVDVVLLTILGTLAAFLYNLAATMLGGLEVTLAED